MAPDQIEAKYGSLAGGMVTDRIEKLDLFTREQVVEEILNFRAREVVYAMEHGSENAAKDTANMRVPELLEAYIASHVKEVVKP